MAVLVIPPTAEVFPPKNEKPSTAKTLPPYCITAEKILLCFGVPLPPKSLPPKNEKRPTAEKLPPYGNTAPPVSAKKKRYRGPPWLKVAFGPPFPTENYFLVG